MRLKTSKVMTKYRIIETVFRLGDEYSKNVYEFNSKNERNDRLNYLLNEWRKHKDYTVEKDGNDWVVDNGKWCYVYSEFKL